MINDRGTLRSNFSNYAERSLLLVQIDDLSARTAALDSFRVDAYVLLEKFPLRSLRRSPDSPDPKHLHAEETETRDVRPPRWKLDF